VTMPQLASGADGSIEWIPCGPGIDALRRRPRVVVFDLDGTLLDTAPDIHAAAAKMLRALGRPELPLNEVSSFIGKGVENLVNRCLAATGGAESDVRSEALALFNAQYLASPTALTRPFDGVAHLLNRLTEVGVSLGICTNKPHLLAERILAETGLAGFFSAVVGGLPRLARKPDPDPLRSCFAQLRVGRADCLYVGDSEVDALTAAAAEIPFALFTGGYRATPADCFAGAFVFDHFDDLAGMIFGLKDD
jgi:phosphoglycolate phosphatase